MSTTHSAPNLHHLRRECISKGIAPWSTIKDMSLQQLEQVLSFAAKEPSFTRDYLAGIALKRAVTARNASPLLATTVARWMLEAPVGTPPSAFIDALNTDEAVEAWCDLIHIANMKSLSARQKTLDGFLARVANRVQYLHQVVLNTTRVVPKNAPDGVNAVKIRYAQMHAAEGLIDHLCGLFSTPMNSPAYVRFFPNSAEQRNPVNGETFVGPISPGPNFSDMLAKQGWLLSKGKLAWSMNPRVMRILSTFFKTWLDAGSYGHRLTTPLVPDGFIRNVPAIFKVTTDLEGNPMCTDGSGFYNPEHPVWGQLVERWGRVIMQMTFVTSQGHFVKGILYPREDISSEYACSFDPNQVKGRMKGLVNQGDTITGTLGVMRCFSETGTMGANFEVGARLMSYTKIAEMYGPEEVPVAKAWAQKLVQRQMEELARGGVEKILASLGNDNPEIAAILNLAKISKSHGQTVNVLAYPAVHQAVMRRLSERLREIGDGFGIRGQQSVFIMDQNVPQGKVVVSGVKPGTKVAIFRYPCILSQGVLIREAMEPLPHHLVDGKLPPCTLILTPRDALLCQGDDDGDIGAVVTNPDQVAFLERYTDRLNVPLLIEPVGTKFTEELVKNGKVTDFAIKQLAIDQRGGVGIATILEAQAAFAGDRDVANVLAAAIQYAVDSAKKRVKGFYMDDMLEDSGWVEENGFMKIAPSAMRDEPVSSEELMDWAKKMAMKRGRGYSFADKSGQLQWRGWNYLYGRKQAGEAPNKWLTRPEYFQKTVQRNGPPAWLGSDSYDQMVMVFREQWGMWEKQLSAAKESPKDMAQAILGVAKLKGVQLNCLAADWQTYQPLREEAGITQYQSDFANVMAKSSDAKARNGTVELLRERLAAKLGELSLDQLFTIVVRENTDTWAKTAHKGPPVFFVKEPSGPTWKVNRPNFGLTVLSTSKLAMVLGLQKEACPFQEENWIVSGVRKDGSAYHLSLGKIIHAKPEKLPALMDHETHFKLTGKHFWQCPACTGKLEDELVGIKRRDKAGGDQWAKDLTHGLNDQYNTQPWYIDVPRTQVAEESWEQDYSYDE